MKGQWVKLGHIFVPNGEQEWMATHAAVPIAEQIGDNLFRIYFSSRDSKGRSYTGALVLDMNKPEEVLRVSERPILSPGKLGEFDDSGAMATWLVEREGSNYLYYVGWNLGKTVPFRNSIGLASGKDEKFTRLYPGPVVDRTKYEPHFCASCCVILDNGLWRMWYLSCTGWHISPAGIPEHRYHIKYAESDDGIDWIRNGTIAIDYLDDAEIAISRPSIIFFREAWHMWYSFRSSGQAYRIGYAHSRDGINWIRDDKTAGLSVSQIGWDSEMVAYPFVFKWNGDLYMLHNGNEFGRSGFGIAKWCADD